MKTKNNYAIGSVSFLTEIMDVALKADAGKYVDVFHYHIDTERAEYVDFLVGTYGVRIPKPYMLLDIDRISRMSPRAFCPHEKSLDDFRDAANEKPLTCTHTTCDVNGHAVAEYVFKDGTQVWIDTRLLKRFAKFGDLTLKATNPNSSVSVFGDLGQLVGIVMPIMRTVKRW